MHLSPQLLPHPLGDAGEAIRIRVFGPRVTPGLASSAPSGAAGGDLSGTYPNPTVVPELASLLLAQRAFLPHVPLKPDPTSLPPSGPAGGDLTGTYPNPTVAAGAVTLAKEAASARPVWNFLINGGMDFAVRQVPATLTTIAQDKYGPDRWRCCRENTDLQYQRVDTAGALETSMEAQFYGTWKKVTSTGKMLVCQVLEGSSVAPLSGRTVVFQAKVKTSASKNMRLGLIQLTSAGTIDITPANIVPTTWGAASTDPTLGSNLSYIAPSSVPSGAFGTVNGNAVDLLATTAWQLVAGVFTVPSNAKNLIAAIWTDGQFASAVTFSVTEAGLYDGNSLRDWLPRSVGLEGLLAARFCQGYGGVVNENVGQAIAFSATGAALLAQLSAPLRASPTVTITANADWSLSNPGVAETALSGTPTVVTSGQRTLLLSCPVAAGLTQGKVYQLIASSAGGAGTGSRLVLDSEL